MAYTIVPDKAAGDTFTEAMWDTYIRDNLNKGVVRPIAETTLSGTAASIDFTSIAADWSHLQVVLYGRGDAAANTINSFLRFNGDSGANYDYQYHSARAGTIEAADAFAAGQIAEILLPANNAPANVFGLVVVTIGHYANTANHKAVDVCNQCKRANTSSDFLTRRIAGVWRSTAAITQVSLLASSGNFVAGTRATLYGLGGV